MSLDSPESILPNEVLQTMSAIEEVRKHQFDFGYRTAFKTGAADLYLKDDKWRMKLPRPTQRDEYWYGNCVEDSIISAAFLREKAGKGSKVTIQHMNAEGMGNTSFSTDHYRTIIEHPNKTNSITAEVDHSDFHSRYLHGKNDQITEWMDLDEVGEKDLLGSLSSQETVDQPLEGIAYTEFDINNTRGIAYLSIDTVEHQTIKIYFSFIMPGLEPGKTDRSIGFPVFFNQLANKQGVINIIETDPFFNPQIKDSQTGNNSGLIPDELKPLLKDWLKEVINRLPDKIETSPK